MKNIRKVLSLLVAVVMGFALAVPAFATEDTSPYSIEIDSNVNDKYQHTYNIYKIFSGKAGTLTKDGETKWAPLADIEWGSDAIKNVLSSSLNVDAKEAAKTIATYENNSTELDNLTRSIKTAIDNGNQIPSTQATFNEVTKKYSFTNLGAGYYLIVDSAVNATVSEGSDTHYAYSKHMLVALPNDITSTTETVKRISPKTDLPKIEKKIVEGDTRVENSTASIGENVTYEVKAAVPNMEHYASYDFVVTDILSKGLKFVKDSNNENVTVSVNIGGTNIPAKRFTFEDNSVLSYTLIEEEIKDSNNNSTGETKLTITFNNFKLASRLVSATNSDVVITYQANVTEEAKRTVDGNPNKVYLEYSNNPNVTTDKGKTPESIVYTYVTDYQIDKFELVKENNSEVKKALEGVKFELTPATGTVLPTIVATTSDDGEYYEVDGRFTTTTPTDETNTQKWVIKKDTTIVTPEKLTVESDANGQVYFKGLGVGTYTITEVEPLAGYNKLSGPITLEITAPSFSADHKVTWNYKVTINGEVYTNEDGTQFNETTLPVENKKGSTLPSTGGMGTTLFIGGGAALMAIAGALLIMKKRNAAED